MTASPTATSQTIALPARSSRSRLSRCVRTLQMDKCAGLRPAPPPPPPAAAAEPAPCTDGRHWSICDRPAPASGSATLYVDCAKGSDAAAGSKAAPFKSLHRAQEASRAAGAGTAVFIRGGTCYLPATLVLAEPDSGVSWSSYNGESVVLSGGAPLPHDQMKWAAWEGSKFGPAGKIMVADLPEGVSASAVDSLFLLDAAGGGPAGAGAKRLVRARFPNGDSEVDRMPKGYDKLGGGVSSARSWEAAGNHSERFGQIVRNSSFYPWFGHSNDLRWVLDYHTENDSSYFDPLSSFWRSEIGTAAKYNSTTFSKRVGDWTNVDDAVIHVIHYDWWGNWQWKLSEVDTKTQTMTFGTGGYQDAHGGPVANNWFFAENLLAELDSPGEC